MAPRYSQKRFSIWRLSAILNLNNFDFFVKYPSSKWKMSTKFDRNRIIRGWDMEIKLFSKWRPSAILNFENCHFGYVTYLHVILRARLIKVSGLSWPVGLTAICAFVYSCQTTETSLRNLTGVHLFSQDCPETCQNGRCRDFDHSDTQELEQASASMADRVS